MKRRRSAPSTPGPLGVYMRERGLSSEDIAAILSEKLGKEINPIAITYAKGRKSPPKAWADALGIDLSSSPNEVHADGVTDPPPFRTEETPPKPPPGTPLVQPLSDVARVRIAGTYGMLGFGVSMATGNEGVKRVTDDCAPGLADAWVKAAEENEFARRVVSLMGAGGATGELVVAHVIWVGGILYVMGKFPEVGLYGTYQRDRVAYANRRAAENADANGGAEQSSGDFVGGFAAPASP